MTAVPHRAALAANALGYQAVWFACVAGAAQGRVWPGVAASLVFTAATLLLGGRWRADARMIAIAVPLGLGMDSLFAMAGWLAYHPAGPLPFAAPAWIAAIWLAFAMTLNHSLAFLRRHRGAAAGLAAAAAPAAYWGASRGFGVLDFAAPALAVTLAVGAAWALLLPAILALETRLARPAVPA